MTPIERPPLYRFARRTPGGVMLGLGVSQCLALAIGVVGGGALLNAHVPLAIVPLPIVAGVAVAFGRWQGQPLHEHLPLLATWNAMSMTGTRRWTATVPRFRHPRPLEPRQPELPSTLAGQTIGESTTVRWKRNGTEHHAAIIHDERERTISAVLRVHGRSFALAEHREQERLLHLWGATLATFCAERGPIGRIRWIEHASPARLDDQLAHLAKYHRSNDTTPPVRAYRALLESEVTRHEVLLVVTVDRGRVRVSPRVDQDHADAAEEVLMEQVRLLIARLDAAGLTVDSPLSAREVAYAWRSRLDPYGAPTKRGGGRSLVELAGLVSVHNAGPMSVQAEWEHVRVDGAVHAAYVVAEWPRLDVPPAWMEPLLLHAGGVRTVAVHYEPVAPSRSRRAIDRDAVRLASDEEQRAKSGFRIGARHHRAHDDVLGREAELVAGHAEFEFVGFVVITARDLDELQRSCAEYEQAAAQSGLELRRLDGRHDLALACALPMGRGITSRRFT